MIRAIQKIVWASGCGTVQLVFSSNEEISKIYEKVKMTVLLTVFQQHFKLSAIRCLMYEERMLKLDQQKSKSI